MKNLIIMKSTAFLFFYCLCLFHNGLKQVSGDSLGESKLFAEQNFLQGKADIVFMLDRSGSVGATNFEIQKGFVESLLTHVAVDANATRVAVISYSATAVLHINYIANPKTKCHLSQELQDIVYTESGSTNTAAALSEARRVLLDGRPNINKAAIIISDGISTAGDDPVAAATSLKRDTGAQIFAFGIGKYLDSELSSLASSVNHVYNCEGFQEFKHLARKIRGDPHEIVWSADSKTPNCDHLCDSPYKGEANDPGCCDHHAKCSCALLAGLHTCVCLPGYFGLEGTWGACRACPRGTYKSDLEPRKACTPCPPGSTTDDEGAKSVQECRCKEGYSRGSGDDFSCTIINCPPLQPPTNGLILNHCQNTFGSECVFMCDDNYEFSVPKSDIRICKKNGQWSGSPAICKKTLCNKPIAPKNGYVTCDYGELTVGKVCKFGCFKGFFINGPKTRNCNINKQWTGMQAHCIAVRCPTPRPLRHGKIINCGSFINPNYGEVCAFKCNYGFERIGPFYMICNENGQLVDYENSNNQSEPFCRDIRNPEITCPKNMTVKTEPRQNYAIVSWELPKGYDNSGEIPKIISSPPGFKPPILLEIGTTSATFTAIDRSGRNTSCLFQITVKDEEQPRILSCPTTIRVNTTDIKAQVFWDEPQFIDNSGQKVLNIFKNAEPGAFFHVGSHFVFYDARDSSENTARCLFEVTVARNYCPYYSPPINGALVCDEWMHGQYCQVQCNYLFDFFSKPAEWYICNTDAQWETLPAEATVPWPDCSKKAQPDGIRQMIRAYYYFGDCNDPEVQNAIKSAFSYNFYMEFGEKGYCQPKGVCSIKAIKVTCGVSNQHIPLVRRRRDIWDITSRENLNIECEIIIGKNEQLVLSDKVLQDFISSIENIDWNLNGELAEEKFGLNFTHKNDTVNALLGSVSITSSKASLLCPSGSVYKNQKCVLCAAGTYYNYILDDCFACPQGWYQDIEGKTECVRCPSGMSTENENSKNETDCRGICPAGTFSITGLETCIACPLGSFQNESKQNLCQLCPDQTTTVTEGSQNANDCQKPCRSGFSSKTGLEPCIPCPIGYYQMSEGQRNCKECHEDLTTLNTGSNSSLNCIEYNACLNNSTCKNGGICFLIHHEIMCQCPEGFTGNNCEEDIDECLDKPCFNGGSCINLVGGFFCSCVNGLEGKLCDDIIKACNSYPCLNGGTCFENNGGYLCSCGTDFEGFNCEIFEPHGIITCPDNELCPDIPHQLVSTVECVNKLNGSNCSTNLNKCLNITCYNGGSCIDVIDSFLCTCMNGFMGDLCEININECENHDCFEGSTCEDLIGSYKCSCPPGWAGARCENEINADFILHFPEQPSLANVATKVLDYPLSKVTVSMWVQTKDTQRLGTLLSYAALTTKSDLNDTLQILDNALTITDCSCISVYINNEQLITDIAINDGLWHHFVFTWSSEQNGQWGAYKDSKLHSSGDGFLPNAVIPPGGQLLLGQEQAEIGGVFHPFETFTGNITKVNIWNSFFTESDVSLLFNLSEDIQGSVISWPYFIDGI